MMVAISNSKGFVWFSAQCASGYAFFSRLIISAVRFFLSAII
jgi:hypothetical protein